MRRFDFLLIALLATVPLARGFAAEDGFKTIHVADLAAMMAKPGAKLSIFDADPPSVRKNEGIIPGAKLLSSSSGYDVAKELPPEKDAKLVFYCHNTF
jgi:rhodanese-related sulfurtransferase